MIKNVKGKTSLILAFVLTASILLAGCGQKKDSSDKGASANQGTIKVSTPMSMKFAYFGTETEAMPTSAQLVVKKVKERFNIDLVFEFIDKNTYREKMNVMVASGQQPDVYRAFEESQIMQAIEGKMFLPLTDIVKNDANWKNVPPELLEAGKYKGEYYTLAYLKNLPNVLNYRVDWAKKLNLKTPATPEELYNMLYAFAKKDPDGNGKDDTYGFTMQQDLNVTDPFWGLFLPVSPYKNSMYYVDPKDDTIKNVLYLSDDMKKALSWFRKAYAEGVLDKQYVLDKTQEEENKFVTGKTGAWLKGVHYITPRVQKLKTAFPEAEVAALPPIKGTYGANYFVTNGTVAKYFLTKACKDPERGKKFMAYYFGAEGMTDMSYGEEGKAYSKEGGSFKWLMEDAKKTFNGGNYITSVFDVKLLSPDPIMEKNIEIAKGYRVTNELSRYLSESKGYQDKQADIAKLSLDKITKIIIGAQDISKYDELVTELKKAGLDEILTEANKIYKANK